jgi:hypothetical protein
MTQVMTPSKPITDGQINKAVANYRTMIETHATEFDSEAVQQVLGDPAFAAEQFAAFRKRVDAVSKQVVHLVTVDRTRTPQQALDACRRVQYIDKKVVAAMPRGTGEKAKLVYFKPDLSAYKNGWISCADVAEEYKRRGLVPDPQAQIDDNAANPEFADEHPNACQWIDGKGNYCFASFDRFGDWRYVHVRRDGRDGRGWPGSWSFAGVPQGSSVSAV